MELKADVLVLGCGIAGCSAALAAARQGAAQALDTDPIATEVVGRIESGKVAELQTHGLGQGKGPKPHSLEGACPQALGATRSG